MFRVALASAPLAALLLTLLPSRPAVALEAYIFRGAGDFSFIADGLTFSNGMDRLARQLEESGIRARVFRWEAGETAYREIMRRRPDAVALMGHSMGALTSIGLAQRLQGSGIRVAYMGLIDIPGPVGATPTNVEWAENFYHAYPVFGMLTKGPGHRGHVGNHYIFGEVHITMDKSPRVHNAMISAIWQADALGRGAVLHAYAAEGRPTTVPAGEALEASTHDPVTTAAVRAPGRRRWAGSTSTPAPIE